MGTLFCPWTPSLPCLPVHYHEPVHIRDAGSCPHVGPGLPSAISLLHSCPQPFSPEEQVKAFPQTVSAASRGPLQTRMESPSARLSRCQAPQGGLLHPPLTASQPPPDPTSLSRPSPGVLKSHPSSIWAIRMEQVLLRSLPVAEIAPTACPLSGRQGLDPDPD